MICETWRQRATRRGKEKPVNLTMSLKEILTSISVDKIQELVGLLKQREALVKQLNEIDAQMEAVAPKATSPIAGSKRRKPSVEIPELLAKTPGGLTLKEIMTALAMKYPQAYITLGKLKNTNKVVFDEGSKKFSLKAATKGKK